jgi:hypothetical protein
MITNEIQFHKKCIDNYLILVKESRSWGITPPRVGEVLKNIQENNGVRKK